MATPDELEAATWFLNHCEQAFPNVALRDGSMQEDWAGIDAWLDREGDDSISLALRRHGPDNHYREFDIRLHRPNQRVEFQKLSEGGGSRYYLQVWEDNHGEIAEYLLADVVAMREAGCFEVPRYAEFWDKPYAYTKRGSNEKQSTLWARMPVDRLIKLGIVVWADIWNRKCVGSEDLDAALFPDNPRIHYLIENGNVTRTER